MRRALDNGLTAVVPDAAPGPLVALALEVRFGSADEGPGQEGLAHLLEHLVVRCAMAGGRVPGGAVVTAHTGREHTRYAVVVRRRHAGQAGQTLLAAFTPLAVSGDALARELAGIRRERAERRSQPGWMLQQALLAGLWDGTPYAHDTLGDPAVTDACTTARAHALHRRWYRPDNAALAVAPGPLPAAAVRLPAAPPRRAPLSAAATWEPCRDAVWASLTASPPLHGVAFAGPDAPAGEVAAAGRAVRAASGLVVQHQRLGGRACGWVLLRAADRAAAGDALQRGLRRTVARLRAPDGPAWLTAEAVIPALRAADDVSWLAAAALRGESGSATAPVGAVADLVEGWQAAVDAAVAVG